SQELNKLANELQLWKGLLPTLLQSTFPVSQDLLDSAIWLLRLWEDRRKELETQIRTPKLRKPLGAVLLRGKLDQIQALGNDFQALSKDVHNLAIHRGLTTSAIESLGPLPGYRSSLTAAN